MIWESIANIPTPLLLSFVTGGLVLNLAPGQDVFFASACGVQGGPKAGALAGLGVGAGVIFHVVLATVGLGAVVAAHPGALLAIKWIGAGYLLFLAWQSWHADGGHARVRGTGNPLSIIRRGALSNILNPKPVLFLLAFLPQFTKAEYGPVWHQILGLGLIFAVTGTLVTMGYGIAAGWLGARLGARMSVMNRIASVMFTALALRMVTK